MLRTHPPANRHNSHDGHNRNASNLPDAPKRAGQSSRGRLSSRGLRQHAAPQLSQLTRGWIKPSARLLTMLIAIAVVAAGLVVFTRSSHAASVQAMVRSWFAAAPSQQRNAPLVGEVTLTATTGTASGSFTTLGAAFTAINAGTHTGVIAISINADTSEGATTATLNASGTGSASYTSISIKPAGGAARTISGTSAAGSPMVDLSGADNVTIDGLNTGGNALTISNAQTSTTAGTSTIRFINDATSNTIQNATINGAALGASTGTILFSTTTGTTGNDNNTVTACSVGPVGAAFPANAILSSGTTTSTTTRNSGIQITNNKIFDFFTNSAVIADGILASGSTDLTITGNSFYQTATRTMTVAASGFIGISISDSSGVNFVISNNFIGGSAVSAGGTAWTQTGAVTHTFIGIRMSIGTTTPSSLQNNTIQNINISTSTTSTINAGISAVTGAMNIGTTTGNTIGSTTGTGSITWTGAASSQFAAILAGSGTPGGMNISNNNIGSITLAGAGTTTFYGIRIQGAATAAYTVSSNTIGSTTTANSITSNSNGTFAGISGTQTLFAASVTSNTIQNLQVTSTGTSASLRGIELTGSIGGQNIASNTIRDFSTATTNTGTTSTSAIDGIVLTGSATSGNTITSNTIRDLSSTTSGATAVYNQGIVITSTPGTTIAKNFIFNLSTASTSSTSSINGIQLFNSSATENIYNNMIRLGTGLSTSINPIIRGIYDNSASTSPTNIYFNSIFIDGTQGGATVNTACISKIVSSTMDVKDNILWNNRASTGAPGSGVGRHYGIQTTSGNPTSNYNDIYTPNNGGAIGFSTSDQITIANWRTATSQDLNSQNSDPQFIDAANATTPNLHIHPTNTTVIEGNGILVSPPTDDFDGQTRASFTPVDIGADAGNFTGIDLTPPVITYTALGNTTSTSNRTLTITVTDASGVPTAGVGLPRLYFRKGVSGAYATTQCSFVSGSSYTCTFDYSLVTGGSVTTGDTVQYYVAAQDNAATPNVTTNPATGASGFTANPPAASTPPTTPSSYKIATPITGSINVGTGQTYTSLTNTGGFFETVNNNVVTGNVTVNITSDLTAEAGTVALNQWTEEGAGNYTMSFSPSGAARSITGTGTSTLLIKLNGADRVTFDGSVGGGGSDRSLTINNSNTAAGTVAVFIGSLGTGAGATNDAIKNCIIKTGSIGTTANVTFGIFVGDTTGAAAGADNDNLTIQNNQILTARTGIQMVGVAATGIDDNASITGNLIGDNVLANSIGRIGLVLQVANNATVSGNTVKNLFLAADTSSASGMSLSTLTSSSVIQNTITGITNSTTSSLTPAGLIISGSTGTSVSQNNISSVIANGGTSNPFGMFTTTSTGMTISQNTIDTVTSTTSGDPIGLSVSTGLLSSTLSRNAVSNVTYTGTGGYGGRGLDINTGSAASALQFSNNTITNIKGDGWNAFSSDSIAGIRITGTTGGLNFYFNSVNLGSGSFAGNTSGTLSAAFYCAVGATALDLRDNVFATNLVNSNAAGAKSYAIYSDAASTAFTTINYNDYFSSGTQGVRGFLTSDRGDLAGIQAGFGQNANSIIGDPLFNSATNLQPQLGSPVLDTGVTLAGTVSPYVDITGATRVDPPSMGAYELGIDSAGPVITYTTLGNTTSTANRPLAISVTDVSGVPTAGAGLPVLYFRKGVAGAYSSTQCTFASGSTYNCTIDNTLVGGVIAGNTIQYFVAAQDSAPTPNVSVNPATGASGLTANPPAAGTPPTSPNSYLIATAITGTRTVCASGCDYTTLTGAAGIFNAINTSVATGNIEIQINGDLIVGEDGTNGLNPLAEEPAGSNYTVKIYPTGSARAITGSFTGALVRFNAADRVTLDGSIGATGTDRSLTITNTNAGTSSAVVWLQSNGADGATSNTIKNLNVVGNSNTTTLIGIGSGSSTVSITSNGTGNNSNTIQNNNISKTQYGIYSGGLSAAAKNTGTVIAQNLINTASPNNVQFCGVLVGFEDGIQITKNNISGLSTANTLTAIAAGFPATSIGVSSTTGNEVTNATITGNLIGTVISTSATGFSAVGISLASAASGTSTIANNMITGVSALSTSPDFAGGIFSGGGTGTSVTRIYHNSVSMTGARGAATYPSYALAIGGSTPTVDVRDNALFNTQTSTGAGQSYAIGLGYTSTVGNYANLTSDYNDLFTSGGSAALSKVGSLAQGSGTNFLTLPAWRTETGRDASSISADPQFASTTDLHITRTAPAVLSPVENAGFAIAAAGNDFDNDTRAATPDIGADEVMTVNFSAATYRPETPNSTTEGGTALITVNRTSGAGAPATVAFSLGGSAIGGAACGAGVDYVTPASLTLNFATGDTAKSFNIVTCADGLFEGSVNETVLMTLTTVSGDAIKGSPDSATLEIVDGDTAPTFAIDDVSHNEGDAGTTSYVFTVTKTGSTALSSSVNFTTQDGSATLADNDYQTLNGTLSFTSVETTKQITVLVNGDTTVEPDEAFNVNLNTPTNATIFDANGTGTIVNDDTTVGVAVTSVTSVAEDGATNLVYTFTRNGVTGGALTVNFSVGGTAAFGTDYTQSGADTFSSSAGTVTFGAGSPTATVTIDPSTDSTYENDETVILTVTAGAGYTPTGAGATGTITNDDAQPSFSIDDITQVETDSGTTNFIFTVTKTGATALSSSVDFTTQDGSATLADNDYVLNTGALTFAAAETTKPITVVVNGDTTYEPTETFNVHLSNASGATIFDADGAGTITNDDAAPASLVVNTTADTDDGFCSTAPGGCTLREAINAANFNADANTITFNIPAGFISGGVFTIQPTTQLPTIIRVVDINGASQTTFGGDTNPSGPEVVLNGALVTPGASGFLVSGNDVTIQSLVINGFTAGGVGIACNNSVNPATINLQVFNNYIGTNPSGTAAVPNTAGVDIHSASAFAVMGNLISGNSGDGVVVCDANNGTISGNRIGTNAAETAGVANTGQGVHLICSTANGNTTTLNTIAFNGGDGYRDQPDYNFGPNNHLRNRVAQNAIFSNTGLGINLIPSTGVDGVTANDSQDPDSGANNLQNFPVITSAKVTGSTRTITGTLNTTPSSTSGYTLQFFSNATCDGTNGEGKVYLGSMTTGNTNANGDVPFSFVPSVLAAGDVVTATATDSLGNTSEFSACFTATTGTAGSISFTSSTFSVPENGGPAQITFQRTGGSDGSVSATFNTIGGGTATAGSDYTTTTSTVTFTDGDTAQKTVNVPITDDSIYEGNETVNLCLTATSINGPSINSCSIPATLTITENDAAPTFSITSTVTHNEGNSGTTAYDFTVTKTGSTAVNATVRVDTADVSATAPSDYTAIVNQVLTFLPADTVQTVTVLVNGDTTLEPDETFTVTLSNPSGATIASGQGTGTGTITNDDTRADLSITKIDSQDPVTQGNNFTYTITVTNSGPQTATNVSVSDPLPAGVTFVSATPSQGSCTGTTTVNCSLGSLANAASATVQIVVTATTAGLQSNTATATATEFDPTTPNQATETTQINAATCTTAPANMVGWWQGNSNANDSAANNTASPFGGVSFVTGKVGQAFNFTGGSYETVAANPAPLNISGNQVTLDGWIKPTADSDAIYFGKTQSSNNDYLLLHNFGQLSSIIKVAGVEISVHGFANFPTNTVTYVPVVGQWTHIALTYDGATIKLYANAQQVGQGNATGNISNDGAPFNIGGRSGSLFFNGAIDEVEVFNRGLTQAEIAAIYNASLAGKCSIPRATTTTITNAASLSATPTTFNAPYTVQWSVSTSNGAPSGNVTVNASGDTCFAAVSAGQCQITPTSAGTKSITATYAGDLNFDTSTSSPAVSHVVNKATPTTTITNAASLASTPTVTGQQYTVQWSVTSSAGTPGGTVTVMVNGNPVCNASVATGQCTVTSPLLVGTDSIVASYGGDTNFSTADSTPAVSHTINMASTTTAITSQSRTATLTGQNFDVFYSVAVTAPGGGTPTGTVQVSDGVTSCSDTVAAGFCTLTLNTVGTHNLTATYQGDANYNASPASSPSTPHSVSDTAVWNGSAGTGWATDANWTTGLAPNTSHKANIPSAGVTNEPKISTFVQIVSFTLASGRTLTIGIPGGALLVNTSSDVAGTIVAGPPGPLPNSDAPESISDPFVTNSLNVTNASGISIGVNTTVNGVLNLLGDITMTGGTTLTQPSAGTSTGTFDVIGNVKRTGFNTSPLNTAMSFGNPFNTIAFSVAATVPTTDITVNLVKAAPATFPTAVKRTYTITPNPSNPSGFTATLRLHYQDTDLQTNTEALLNLRRFNGTGWVPYPRIMGDTTDNWVENNLVHNFSPWTLSSLTPTASDATITGRITEDDGAPVEGAVVRLSGGQSRMTITDAAGNYHFDNVETTGFYTVTPSRANFSFSPAQRSFSPLGAHTEALFNASQSGSGVNPLDTTEYFVRQQYLDFLNREPDEAGLNFWVNNIQSCGDDANCLAVKRIDTSAAFFLSIEFQQTGYLVYKTYQSAYGDLAGAPVPLRLSEFKPDTAKIGNGVIVNQTGWETVLENNKQAYLREFVQRARFVAAYPAAMTPAELVDRLFMNAGVTPAEEDRSAAIGEFGLAATSADTGARGRALRRVAENSALARQESNQAFVLMQYFGYLRRDANAAPDTDFSGYNFWLEKLIAFNGNFREAEMVKAFLVAGEYRGRFPR